MQITPETYQNNPSILLEEYLNLKKKNISLEESLRELQAENIYLKQELSQLKRMIFGTKSERYVPFDTGQLSLNLDIEQQEPEKVETEQVYYTRKKPGKEKGKPVRLSLPSHLHRQEIVINPRGDISGAKKIGEEITEILEYTPGKFYVEKYVRPKFLLPEDKGIIIGELPSFPIPKGNAGAGLLAHLLISKFVDHLPFYRQVQQFKRHDIAIAESMDIPEHTDPT
jgi:transposase